MGMLLRRADADKQQTQAHEGTGEQKLAHVVSGSFLKKALAEPSACSMYRRRSMTAYDRNHTLGTFFRTMPAISIFCMAPPP
jgi:hypothetical protein